MVRIPVLLWPVLGQWVWRLLLEWPQALDRVRVLQATAFVGGGEEEGEGGIVPFIKLLL